MERTGLDCKDRLTLSKSRLIHLEQIKIITNKETNTPYVTCRPMQTALQQMASATKNLGLLITTQY